MRMSLGPARLTCGFSPNVMAGMSYAPKAWHIPAGVREDDGRMADDLMALDERIARLEVTVATGFSELNTRIENLEIRVRADLGADILGVENRLRGEIGRVEERLRGDIGGVEDRLRGDMGAFESRLRVLIEANRDEQRQFAEGFGAALERIEARLELMHREHLQARDDHARAIEGHERRIVALEQQSDSTRTN